MTDSSAIAGRRSVGGHGQGESALVETYLESLDVESLEPEERLRRERDFWRGLYAQLVSSFPEGAFTVARNGEITNWNPAMEELNGTGANSVLGENAYEFFKTEGKDETLAETVIRRNETVKEDDTRTVPHSDRYYQVYAVPLRDPTGTPVGAFEVTPDVSEFVHQRQEYERLQEAVSEEVEDEIVDLEAHTESIAETTADLRDLGVDQTERMETIAGEVSNQSATIEEIASTADQVHRTSDEAAELAEEGADSATEAIDTMEGVAEAADEVASEIATLHESINEIDEIVDVIDGIADQTNILALNAKIEAAQAGKAGAGFAIVADEVKSLAEDSQDQAGRIEETIERIQAEIESTVSSLETTTEQIDDGVGRVEGTLERIDEIAAAVEETAQGVSEVSDAIDDQAAGSEEIAATVDAAVDELTTLRDELEGIAEATREQRESVSTVRSTVDQLSS
ncbi:methyl-accepting chemotaxis protein [Natrialbaceae archaeon GCM10025810]|uniref:methyl-accepting chemotaxis protein n=1 Tax=Halovalidus salilacus TaxID=3075124 RepID=UPI00361DCF71